MATPQEKPRRAGIYVRISQDSTGKKAGVQRQRKDCYELAARMKWTVVDTFDDNDISAYQDGKVRPGFENLLAAVGRGDIDAIICWHPDRLYRRIKDLQRLVEVTDKGVVIASVNGGEIDLSHATGKMLARILGSVAEMESEHKGERRRRANLERAMNGVWRADGPRVFGYTQGGEPLEPEAQAVRDAANDVLNKVSLRSIAMDWNKRGLLTPKAKTGKKKGGAQWTNLQLARLLKRPVYAGQLHYVDDDGNPQVTEGDWEALFDEETHIALVELLNDPTRRPASRFVRLYIGSGVYICGRCGEKMYAKFPHGQDRMMYACRTKHLYREGEPIDIMAERMAFKVLSETDIMARLTDRPGIDTVALRAKKQGLVSRKDGLATLFADGALDGPAVTRESNKLKEQIAGIDKMMAEAAQRSIAATLLVDGAEGLRRHWDEASHDVRGKVVDELMTVTVMPTRNGRGFDPDLIQIAPKL